MAVIDKNDIQTHLPVDKLLVDAVPDSITEIELDVERVVKGELSGTFEPLTLAAWDTPDHTPAYIRAAGGRLGAALLYALRLAQEFPGYTDYAQHKYDEGMEMLAKVVGGLVTLPEVPEIVDTGGHLTTANYNVSSDPVFSMDMEF